MHCVHILKDAEFMSNITHARLQAHKTKHRQLGVKISSSSTKVPHNLLFDDTRPFFVVRIVSFISVWNFKHEASDIRSSKLSSKVVGDQFMNAGFLQSRIPRLKRLFPFLFRCCWFLCDTNWIPRNIVSSCIKNWNNDKAFNRFYIFTTSRPVSSFRLSLKQGVSVPRRRKSLTMDESVKAILSVVGKFLRG